MWQNAVRTRGLCTAVSAPIFPSIAAKPTALRRMQTILPLVTLVIKPPAGILNAYSYTDPDYGDNPPGARVEQCKKWAKVRYNV